MLSNTAVPKYYGQFRKMVTDGKIPICKNIAMEMNRIDLLIDNPGVYYDDEAVEGWIRFCENELTLTDGNDLNLLFTFKLWGEQVFGWYYFETRRVYVPDKEGHGGCYVKKRKKKRLTNKQFLIVSRRNAKSIYAACMQAYGLVVDQETTHQVVSAPVMKQAEETLAPIRTAITRSRGPLFKFLTRGSLQNTTGARKDRMMLASTKKGIENFLTNSLLEIRPMSINKLQGLRNKYSSIDEWLSGDPKEDIVGALEQGASKLDDYLIISTSSEGCVRNGVGDSIKMELKSILKRDYIAPNVSIWWYQQDDKKEIAHPELWLKSNPNLDFTVTYDVIQQDVDRAEQVPSTANDILAKVFGIPTEGYTYYFTYEETIPFRKRCYWNLPCSMGCDLSQGDDFCAFTFLFPLKNGKFGVKVRAYITERTMRKLHPAMHQKYMEFMDEGTLVVMNGTILNMDEVYDDLFEHVNTSQYDVLCVGYDPYNAKEFIERWCRDHGPFGVEKVPQGVKTETVPLGELKDLSEDRCLLFDEKLMQFSLGNCIVLEDTNGNRKLWKKRQEDKIDNVAALMDAFVSYKINMDLFE